MAITFAELFNTQVVTGVISEFAAPKSRLQSFFRMRPSDPAYDSVDGRTVSWDIFNRTRQLAQIRAPGTGPGSRAPDKTGQKHAECIRTHEQIPLLEDKLYNMRPIGGAIGTVDERGQRYVALQQRNASQRVQNNREMLISRMTRGSLQIKIEGDTWHLVDSGGHITIDFGLPAGNQGQLDMLGEGDILNVSWATVATADIPQDCLQINRAFERLHGQQLTHAWCDSVTISLVMNNAKMSSIAGTANRVFSTFQRSGFSGPDGVPDTGFTIVFEAIPWLTWHVYDGVLEVDGSDTAIFPSNKVLFTAEPDPQWVTWVEGSEVVRAARHLPAFVARGLTAWVTQEIDPASFVMKTLDIGLPVPYVPTCMAWATVVF